ARLRNYCRPLIHNGYHLKIVEGRHPVVETSSFIPNSAQFDATERLHLITGPNMAGKSTFIRQVALIVLLAQIGSYVPAKSAEVGIVDKLFTRIGASDDLSRGQSTFMVEMSETANILNNATAESLVILDEIGRGTSTYDGIAIAWSVAEYLLQKTCKTLFATHYFELTRLEEEFKGAVNYNVAVHESEKGIVFLRKIVRGGTDKSYGIHVAKLAGLPPSVIKGAQQMLEKLHANSIEPTKKKDLQLEFL
ncbi:MAG TPA: DNA mismatch repair protein MutS, partial [Rhabdochlamydiaceae bacterium]|nr:DNA mismatch repair protein MutS [Rhabdochlamydiaceae bacterium]